mmetsp:Transcript_4082/g.7832  ORF Transcript_4082/g.7832 Transcript_4082/m.7832 type:complete len:521 (-) Transcript_4082:322-1884(-)
MDRPKGGMYQQSRLLQIICIVFSLFFLLQIVIILQPRYNLQQHSYDGIDDSSILNLQHANIFASTNGRFNSHQDGTFNTFPIYHQKYEMGFHSNAHCIGNNFQENAWKFQSCHFQNLCFDTEQSRFILFTSQEQIDLERALAHDNLTHFSPASNMNTTVSVGTLNPKWGKEHELLRWYPELRPVDDELKTHGYYMLQTDKVLIPFHSMAGFNPGHLVWDDFLAIYTLLTSFDLLDKEMVIIRYDLSLAMWASCQRQWAKCQPILKKFLPLIGTELIKTSTQNQTILNILHNNHDPLSKYVCSPYGAAGMGLLGDHGFKLHGWQPSDYDYAVNIGRGGSIYQFRNWMMTNIGIPPDVGRTINKSPYRILFSEGSSHQRNRNVSFKKHSQILQERLGGKYELEIRFVKLSTLSLKEQIELTSGTSIFITMCGGGAVTAMFLPKGASLFAYFNEMDGDGETPARLDWDLLNNLGYIRVHWLPRPSNGRLTRRGRGMLGPQPYDFDAFVSLVDHELDIISHLND